MNNILFKKYIKSVYFGNNNEKIGMKTKEIANTFELHYNSNPEFT